MTSFGVHPTYEDAEVALNVALIKRASKPGASAGVLTFATFGRRVLDIREEEGVRAIRGERGKFRVHLERCAFADMPVSEVTSADIADLLRKLSNTYAADGKGKRKLARAMVTRLRVLLSCIFTVAVERGLRATNPCIGVVVKRAKRDASVAETFAEKWDWLRGDEQAQLLRCEQVPLWFRTMVRFAWGTGLRQGEQWNLELRDVHFSSGALCSCGAPSCVELREKGAHVFVRYGSKGNLPKGGRTRATPLFGEGLAAIKEWLEILPTYARSNPEGLTFPTLMGHRRREGAPSVKEKINGRWQHRDVLPGALRLAGITREVRWHDLRHTCASSLISGTWGRAWALIQVRDMLGHADIQTTQRYAHLCADSLRNEGESTPGHGVITHVIPNPEVPVTA